MTWLTIREYLCHKWPRMCSLCVITIPALSLFKTCHQIFDKSNTTGVKSGVHDATPDFSCCSCCSIFCFLCTVLYIIVCLFAIFFFSYCPLRQMACGAATKVRHFCLSLAIFCRLPHEWFNSFISASTVRRHVILGLPLVSRKGLS